MLFDFEMVSQCAGRHLSPHSLLGKEILVVLSDFLSWSHVMQCYGMEKLGC